MSKLPPRLWAHCKSLEKTNPDAEFFFTSRKEKSDSVEYLSCLEHEAIVEEAKRQAREDEEASAVSFDWISTATDLKEIQEYARNCAYLIRTGTLPPEPKGAP